MDAAGQDREAKKKELLNQLSELMIEEQVEQGVFLETPHYSIIERHAMTPGSVPGIRELVTVQRNEVSGTALAQWYLLWTPKLVSAAER